MLEIKYLGSTDNGQQFSASTGKEFHDASQSSPIFCVARCPCGWCELYSTLELAPDNCPRCGAELPMVTTND